MKPYEDVPNSDEMRVLPDVLSIEGLGKKTVILRGKITEEFWQQVIDNTKDFRVCAVGTPGIGKTSSTCILIRLLLEQHHAVLYHVRSEKNDGFVYMFTPPANSTGDIDVQVVPENKFIMSDEKFDKPSFYYVVDPGKTKGSNCDPSNTFQGKVIIVSSPNEGHWGFNEFVKRRDNVMGIFLYLPVWTLRELLNAKQYFNIRLSDEIIVSRYEEVGGIPRHIFDDETSYRTIVAKQNAAINSLTESQLRSMTSNDVDAVQTFDKSDPKSLLMVYERTPDYNFQNFAVAISSQRVLLKLVDRNNVFLWNLMISVSVEDGLGWKIFEAICRNRMLGNAKYYKKYRYHNGTDLVNRTPASPLKLGGCSRIQGIQGNLISAARENERVLYYSLDFKHEFIDFVYRIGTNFFAFQVTIGGSKTCNTKHLSTFAEEAGGPSNFLLHYLTYDKQFDKFKLNQKEVLRAFLKPNKEPNDIPGDDWTINVVCIPRPNPKHNSK